MAAVDNLMNIRLEEVTFSSHAENKFEKLKECTIRGNYVKFVRFPDDILDRLASRQDAAISSSGSGRKGRGKEGKGTVKPGEVSKTVTVPAVMIGAIIGRSGETIKRFCVESGARIEVIKEQLDNSDQRDQRTIFLSGSQECVDKAASLIQSLVRDRASGRKHRDSNSGGSGKGAAHLSNSESQPRRSGKGKKGIASPSVSDSQGKRPPAQNVGETAGPYFSL
eukprot:TRINITY_DN11731_c0_g1_i1.p1 TRINITY_DN11731_c0_g1~~TRINITY_DN11731_c0_g1_i1.p1  ORF type:complete len:259 (+),score=45.37 TRINITY_DN11731_c0_g1_i1:110-778(+)